MSRAVIAAGVLLAAVIAGKTALHADTTPARPTAAFSQDLPDGPGKAELKKLCDGCHDLMFTVSTRETEEGWTQIVNDMRAKGTDGTEEEFAKVIAYLTANMGKPKGADR